MSAERRETKMSIWRTLGRKKGLKVSAEGMGDKTRVVERESRV